MRHCTTIFFTALWSVFLCGHTSAQDTTDFYNQIKNYNFATIWTADSFLTEGREIDKRKIKRAEPLGFIDTTFQRFYIHFSSATKNKDNPYEYVIIGKTKVKDNICDFKGTITVKKVKLFASTDFPQLFKEGFAICEVLFYEDKNQNGSGFIKGKLTTNFYIDSKGRFKYNSLQSIADDFSNNQFAGTWTSYKTNKTKKCNWGDYRIPDSGDLDIGAGEFSPADKYVKYDWQSYQDRYVYGKPQQTKEEWWK